MNLPYTSPNAFRRALTDRLRAIAQPYGPWPLADLQRQFAYDRLLARLYINDSDWVVKGATALLAREIAARHTIDLDVYRATSRDQAEHDLRRAAAVDLSDWFVFDVPPLTSVSIPGLSRPGYRAYPLVDHIADKICAILETHGPTKQPSHRFKDLVDLVALARSVSVNATDQLHALKSEAERRNLILPVQFKVPDQTQWTRGYAAEARRAINAAAKTLEEAMAIVRPLLNPILDGTAVGTWSPKDAAWAP